MSHATDNTESEVKRAAEQVNPAELNENIQDTADKQQNETLDSDEKTPFIDDSLRTDDK